MASPSQRHPRRLTIIAELALLFISMTRAQCPVAQVPGCSCPTTFGVRLVVCKNLGSISQLPKFSTSRNSYTSLTVSTSTVVHSVQSAAFNGISVSSIVLSGLAIQTVSVDAFVGANVPRLQEVNLGNNALTEVFPGTFRQLSSLLVLDLSNNQLRSIDKDTFIGLTSLSTLYLYNNYLEIFSGDAIFSVMGGSLRQLSLNGNQLVNLVSGTFSNLTHLQQLQLHDNHLSAIDQGTFTPLQSIRALTLQNNELGSSVWPLNATLFDGLARLQSLDLSNNNIGLIDANIFTNLSSLTSLTIAYNQLQLLPVEIFGNQQRLETLDVSLNQITALDHGLLTNLTSLVSLSLNNNSLSYIDRDIFSGLFTLTVLNLANNKISAIDPEAFRDLELLASLDVSGNLIETLPPEMFSNCPRLSDIYMMKNRVRVLSRGIFANLSALTTLYLEDNAISQFDSGVFYNLSSLTYLSLSRNKVSSIRSDAFVGLGSLTGLDLNTNLLRELPVAALSQLPQLTTINVNNNLLTTVPDAAFGGLNNLNRIQLSNNNLRDVSDSAFSDSVLAKLQYIDLSGSHIASIPPGLFNVGLKSLAEVNLSSNSLSSKALYDQPFEALNGILATLDLSANQLTFIPDDLFDGLVVLRTLRLEYNLISFLSPRSFNGLIMLSTLSLANNALSSPALSGIINLPTLTMLQVDNNFIESLPDNSFRGCTSLSYLGLRGNNITVLNSKALQNIASISELDVGFNNLSALALSNIAISLPLLSSLHIDNNDIGPSLMMTTFVGGENTIKLLDVSNNGFSSEGLFPAVANLNRLETFIADSNRLTSLPQLGDIKSTLAAGVRTLSLRNNLLNSSSLEVLSEFAELSALHLDGNIITERLPPRLLSQMFKLIKFTVANNGIEILENDTFHVAGRALTHLSMANNSINVVDSHTFTAMPSILDLDLSGNRISKLSLPVLMPYLRRLTLANNLMTEFPSGARSVPVLASLDLSGNLLQQLPPLFIRNKYPIALINWSDNRLRNIDNFTLAGTIGRLDLSRNSLKDIDGRVLEGLSVIGDLDLSYNMFEYIPSSVKTISNKLTVLRLDYNRITRLDGLVGSTSQQSNLERLFLRNNFILQMPYDVLAFWGRSLVQLDLRNNLLSTLDEKLNTSATKLEILALEGNPWNCDCNLSWIRSMNTIVQAMVDWPTCQTPPDLIGTLLVCYAITDCIDNSTYTNTQFQSTVSASKCAEAHVPLSVSIDAITSTSTSSYFTDPLGFFTPPLDVMTNADDENKSTEKPLDISYPTTAADESTTLQTTTILTEISSAVDGISQTVTTNGDDSLMSMSVTAGSHWSGTTEEIQIFTASYATSPGTDPADIQSSSEETTNSFIEDTTDGSQGRPINTVTEGGTINIAVSITERTESVHVTSAIDSQTNSSTPTSIHERIQISSAPVKSSTQDSSTIVLEATQHALDSIVITYGGRIFRCQADDIFSFAIGSSTSNPVRVVPPTQALSLESTTKDETMEDLEHTAAINTVELSTSGTTVLSESNLESSSEQLELHSTIQLLQEAVTTTNTVEAQSTDQVTSSQTIESSKELTTPRKLVTTELETAQRTAMTSPQDSIDPRVLSTVGLTDRNANEVYTSTSDVSSMDDTDHRVKFTSSTQVMSSTFNDTIISLINRLQTSIEVSSSAVVISQEPDNISESMTTLSQPTPQYQQPVTTVVSDNTFVDKEPVSTQEITNSLPAEVTATTLAPSHRYTISTPPVWSAWSGNSTQTSNNANLLSSVSASLSYEEMITSASIRSATEPPTASLTPTTSSQSMSSAQVVNSTVNGRTLSLVNLLQTSTAASNSAVTSDWLQVDIISASIETVSQQTPQYQQPVTPTVAGNTTTDTKPVAPQDISSSLPVGVTSTTLAASNRFTTYASPASSSWTTNSTLRNNNANLTFSGNKDATTRAITRLAAASGVTTTSGSVKSTVQASTYSGIVKSSLQPSSNKAPQLTSSTGQRRNVDSTVSKISSTIPTTSKTVSDRLPVRHRRKRSEK